MVPLLPQAPLPHPTSQSSYDDPSRVCTDEARTIESGSPTRPTGTPRADPTSLALLLSERVDAILTSTPSWPFPCSAAGNVHSDTIQRYSLEDARCAQPNTWYSRFVPPCRRS